MKARNRRIEKLEVAVLRPALLSAMRDAILVHEQFGLMVPRSAGCRRAYERALEALAEDPLLNPRRPEAAGPRRRRRSALIKPAKPAAVEEGIEE